MNWPPTAKDFKNYMKRRDALKPEQRVLDDIEELVNEELTHTPDDFHKNNERYVKCELCQQQWHGLPAHSGCPGAYATPEQRKRWDERPTGTGEYLGCVTTEYEGTMCAVHLYRGNHGFVGLLQPMPDDQPRGLDCDLYTFDEARSTLSVRIFDEGFELPVTYVPQLNSGPFFVNDTP